MLLPLLLALCPQATSQDASQPAAPSPLPERILDQDDLVVTRSCRIVIPEGKVIPDSNGNGVIQVKGKGITIRFAKGSVLRGAAPGTPWDGLSGIGIRAADSPDLVLSGLRVHGFKVGVQIENCSRVLVEDLDASDNYRQRLRSTPEREDVADWLYPHDNDAYEWRKKWGAALYVEQSLGPTIRRVHVRRGQNGIVLDRVVGAKVYDNDCSFLSGWGLALWRTSKCIITRNAFDFCVRGYSHDVYNRGQDSAGILMFEQCEQNFVAENSATHGGDGFFGNSGKEALGQKKPPWWFKTYYRKGNRRNAYLRNDFSYAAAHGFEQTFSLFEQFQENRLVGNAICGIWGGYSQYMNIHKNHFEANGDRGYGLERGGINIEHGKGLTITDNIFVSNRCGIHLWVDEDKGLKKLPWVRDNPETGGETWILSNQFHGDDLALHLRGQVQGVRFDPGDMKDVKVKTKFEGGAALVEFDTFNVVSEVLEKRQILGESHPVGARKPLRGRENIVMGVWGPWDHESPLLRPLARTEKGVVWELYGVSGSPTVEFPRSGMPRGLGLLQMPLNKTKDRWRLELLAEDPGLHDYDLHWTGKGFSHHLKGSLLATLWKIRVFAWKTDPRKDYAAWKKEALQGALLATLPSLHLRYGMQGPRSLKLSQEISQKGPGKDRFGTFAETKILLPAGRYRIRTQSDDGIRVYVDGKGLIDDWTWHAPKTHEATLTLDGAREVHLRVEHFELDGYSILELDLERDPEKDPKKPKELEKKKGR